MVGEVSGRPMSAQRKLPHRFKRFARWLKQVVLLGRTDWRRASDDANPPRLSQSEREELRPRFDVNVIRPRSLAALERTEEATRPSPRPGTAPTTDSPAEVEVGAGAPKPPKSRVFRRHHRERSRQIAVNPLSPFAPEKRPISRLERLFEKWFGRRD
jgi:hypothetical protein